MMSSSMSQDEPRNGGKGQTEQEDLMIAEQEQELPPEIEEKIRKGTLRSGYSTGTCAAAATKASLVTLLTGMRIRRIDVSLPKGREANLTIAWTRTNPDSSVTSSVIKDAGDDPDVTHGAEICSTVSLLSTEGQVVIEGGIGVGRVTKPGLGLELGKAAINPVPFEMIMRTVKEASGNTLKSQGIKVVISVPRGEEIAKQTDNPRLGIIGGISILGTTGIVLPYSTASFAASIRQSLDVSIAMGSETVVLTTGGRSEDFSKVFLGNTVPDHAFIQVGDFIGYSIKQCLNKKVEKVVIAGFIGKLTKMAMGVKQTHVRGSHVSMEFMASIASECMASQATIEEIRKANTARHVSEIIDSNRIMGFHDAICRKVFDRLSEYSNGKIGIRVVMFEFDGKVKGMFPR
ncbi:MAG: cobalt-precorrin-5B (C(1))-methyltransferase [Thermoproteota archaeon]|nr:cobalt-precorrin-5B (C(1))-methyltransferase [Thermoproteota archaeon]